MKQEIEEILSLRLEIKKLNTRFLANQETLKTTFDHLDLRSVSEVLKQAKSLLEDKPKLLGLIDDVRQTFDFYTTCQTMFETADESILEPLKSSVRGAAAALMLKLGDYVKLFPIEKIEQAKRLMMPFELGYDDCQERKTFNDEEILTRIESMIKILPNDELFLASEVATQESKLAVDTFAGALICQGTSLRSEEPVLVDIETLANNAKRALVHERYIKETQQSKGNSGCNLEVLLSKRIPELKAIFDQMLIWFDELIGVYRINKKIRDGLPNLDVSSLEEKSETDIGRDLSNTSAKRTLVAALDIEDDFDDGLSDVSEDVSMAIDDTDIPQRLRK